MCRYRSGAKEDEAARGKTYLTPPATCISDPVLDLTSAGFFILASAKP